MISYFNKLSDELLKFVMRVIVISIRSTRDLLRELLSRPNISSYSVTLCLVTMNLADADSTDSTRLTIDSTESTSPLTEL